MKAREDNIDYKPLGLNVEDDDAREASREKAIVDGGMPIYIQGGKRGKLKTGGDVDYMMDDIEINLELIDRGKLTQAKVSDGTLGQALYTFRASGVNEIDDWLNSNAHDFIAKCLRKFKIHMAYSNSLKGLFFDIAQLFESYVVRIIEKAGFDKKSKLAEYESYDAANKIESSSIILYQFGKDADLNAWLEKNAPALHSYIIDTDRWSYKGWCPHVPDIRYRHLLGFPLEMVVQLLGDKLNFEELGADFAYIKKIAHPSIEKFNIPPTYDASKPLSEKIDALHARIKSNRALLKEWETYYVKCSNQVIEQAAVFEKYFPLFGKD